ncbi:hypothetical protein Taro_038215 [Colocasia esculenta]|uniref:Uncharacterized protein n=1 Tax=Colocasia esculenta TaxID=4460 RepID=A0A843WD98_COLES|nr:hypothetical protein [Colocasia esculenta]
MAPFLIQGAAAASQSLNTAGVNHAEGYLTEYKLVKYKLSCAWDDEEVAAGRGQKEMAKYAETIPVSLYLIRLDEDVSARGSMQKAKAAVRGGAVKEAPETAAIAEAASLPQSKRKEKRKAALVESQAGGRTFEEEVSNEPRAHKKKKATKSMPRVAGSAAEVEEEEEDLEPLLARGPRLRTRMPERRASVTPLVDRSEAVMKMSAELGLIMVSDESGCSGGRAKSPVHEAQEVLPGEGGAEQGGAPDEGAQLSAEDGVVAADSGRGVGGVNTLTPVTTAGCGTGEAVLPRGDIPQGSGDILPPMPPTSVITEGRVVGEDAAEGELGRDLSFQDLPAERGAEVQVVFCWSFPLRMLNHCVHTALEVDHMPKRLASSCSELAGPPRPNTWELPPTTDRGGRGEATERRGERSRRSGARSSDRARCYRRGESACRS